MLLPPWKTLCVKFMLARHSSCNGVTVFLPLWKTLPDEKYACGGCFQSPSFAFDIFCGLWKPSVNTTTRLWRAVVDIKTVNAYWSLCQIVLTVRTLHCALCSVTFFVDKMCAITMQIATLSTQFPTNAQFVGEPFDAIPTVTVKEVTNIIT